ncbi:hypothetical protein NLG97_g9528 [Lecanicillium saksenae]|uniref:Uncharacterized protein n=1 Tax=Lecanicillium saksenae TaxID=468837 RepID=A0ACC1QHL0_9HYPO|nr:hypothetical protein NLG97_g9528 [Lecanicillium saksenae]
MGTDINPGLIEGKEIAHGLDAGLTNLQAIKAATATAPLTLGRQAPKSGQLKVGYDADVLGLTENPAEDVRVLQKGENIKWVWKGGKLFKGPEKVTFICGGGMAVASVTKIVFLQSLIVEQTIEKKKTLTMSETETSGLSSQHEAWDTMGERYLVYFTGVPAFYVEPWAELYLDGRLSKISRKKRLDLWHETARALATGEVHVNQIRRRNVDIIITHGYPDPSSLERTFGPQGEMNRELAWQVLDELDVYVFEEMLEEERLVLKTSIENYIHLDEEARAAIETAGEAEGETAGEAGGN